MILSLHSLQQNAPFRKPGYVEAVTGMARPLGNDQYELTSEQVSQIARDYRFPMGLGDAVASIATPIARALKLSCIDPTTQQLRPESPCARRKAAMNTAIPSLGVRLGS